MSTAAMYRQPYVFVFVLLWTMAWGVPVIPTQVPVEVSPYFKEDYVYPSNPAADTTSFYPALSEMLASGDLGMFAALVAQDLDHHRLFTEHQPESKSLVFVPTNKAMLKFLKDVQQSVGSAPQAGASPMSMYAVMNELSWLTKRVPHVIKIVIETHIVKGDWTEHKVRELRSLTTLSGITVNTSAFPQIFVPISNTSARRVFRPVLTSGGKSHRICSIDHVLLPAPIHVLLEESPLDDLEESPEPVSSPPSSIWQHNAENRSDTVSVNLNFPNKMIKWADATQMTANIFDLSLWKKGISTFEYGSNVAVPFINDRKFDTVVSFLQSRTDCAIFSTLVRFTPGLLDAIDEESLPLHVFAPTDKSIFRMWSSFDLKQIDSKWPDTEDQESVKKFVRVVMSLWSFVPGLPSLVDIILYHFFVDADQPINQLNGTVLESLSGGYIRVSNNGRKVEDADYSRPSATTIASYATLEGFVTTIDGVLTKFDVRLAKMMAMVVMFGGNNDSQINSTSEYQPGGAVWYTPIPQRLVDDDEKENDIEDAVPSSEPSERKGACFPGEAEVMKKDGRVVKMKNLKGGDVIKVSDSGRMSKVIAFTHKQRSRVHPFLEIKFSNNASIVLSEGHYVYVERRLKAAGSVIVGDIMTSGIGKSLIVSGVREVWKTGKYAPHTFHGDLVVNGVVVSAYTTEIHPMLAHALLAPVRLMSFISGLKEPLGSLFYRGGGWVAELLPSGHHLY